MDKAQQEAYFKALDLAEYINHKHREKYDGRDISNIKLQKSLYFLFAYWGGFARKSQLGKSEITIDKELLFDDEIQAWVYGPVLPNVYNHYKSNNFKSGIELQKIISEVESSGIVAEFINDLLSELFDISDFKLVDLAHADNAWKKHFKSNANYHNDEIPKEEIISEYATREINY